MEEIFKDIPNYEGLYQVSNLGGVKSLERKGRTSDKIINGGISGGYMRVSLIKNKKPKGFCVHQLVAMAFLNHKPNGYRIVVNHINFDKLNNNVKNLELITARENSNLKHIKSSSNFVGVSYYSNKYIARIVIGKSIKYLGSFDCEIEASKAYNSALSNL